MGGAPYKGLGTLSSVSTLILIMRESAMYIYGGSILLNAYNTGNTPLLVS